MTKAANVTAPSFDIFDTKTLSDKGVEVEIMNADGEPSGFFFTVLGKDSSAVRRINERFQRERNQHSKQYGVGKRPELLETLLEDQLASYCAEVTVAWRHASGGDMPFSVEDKAKVAQFYKEHVHVRDQVVSFTVDRGNFIKR